MTSPAKDHPMLFSAPMVRALLAGTKSQTRRIVKSPAADGSVDRWPYVEGERLWVKESIARGPGELSAFVADGARTKATAWPWKRDRLPGMFCPKGLSRITLELTDVRVERLQAITEADAAAEGVGEPPWGTRAESYATLWDSINSKKPGCAWSANPWVWVLSFRVAAGSA